MRQILTFIAVTLSCSAACTKTEPPAPSGGETTAAAPATATPTAAAPAPGGNALPAPPDVAAAPADAQKTASGLASKVIKPGTGTTHPSAEDNVEVQYTGWTTDGKMFDSSRTHGSAARFPLNRVIKGWTEGVQLMTEGEQRRFWIPAELAYGASPPPGAPAGTLVFDVELVKIIQAPKPIPAPPDVAAAPKDAKKTSSGLTYKVLEKGKGGKHPKASDTVEVDYTGWTTDGKMFDSSIVRGQKASFPLGHVIKGWTEGVQLMTEGEKTRFWIPVELAYNNQPGRPQGMLVFDIELHSIK